MTCPACHGSGTFHGSNGQRWRCWRCGGTGTLVPAEPEEGE